MVIRELTYQLHKLEALESALVSADHHDKKSVLGIGGKNPDRSIPSSNLFILIPSSILRYFQIFHDLCNTLQSHKNYSIKFLYCKKCALPNWI